MIKKNPTKICDGRIRRSVQGNILGEGDGFLKDEKEERKKFSFESGEVQNESPWRCHDGENGRE